MNVKEAADFAYRIKEMAEQRGKSLTPVMAKGWFNAVCHELFEDFSQAVDQDFKENKYMPEPWRILAIIADIKNRRKSIKPEEVKEVFYCDPKIANAWVRYMKFAYGFDTPGSHQYMSIDEALVIVNQQAALHNNPDSILREHKLAEYW